MGNDAMPTALPIVSIPDPSPNRLKWWQWLLLYPTLSLAVISAAPTWFGWIQAIRLGVSPGEVAPAREQNRLWEKNFACPQSQEIQWIKTPRNIEIGARVCPTGDILVLAKRAESDRTVFRWVSAEILERQAYSLFGLTSAYAATSDAAGPAGTYNVVNQRWLKAGLLKQRVRQPNGGCVDLLINSYTGSVVSRTPVSCSADF